MTDPDLSESRSAKVALAAVRYLPIDDLSSLVAAYERLWIPSVFYCVERWYRRLNYRLDQRIVDAFRLYGVSKRSVAASIVRVRSLTDDAGASITVVAHPTGATYEITKFGVIEFDAGDNDLYIQCDDGRPTGVRFFISVFHQEICLRP